MNIWHNGYVKIPVTDDHIRQSMEKNSSHCMTAEAIRDAIPDATFISVDVQTIRWTRRGVRFVFLTPHVCQGCIIAFDQGERDAIKPFFLRMRPAFVAKAGKKRTHTPDDHELKEAGLKRNKVQLHVSKPKPASNPRSLAQSLSKWGKPSTKMELAPECSKDQLRRELAAACANTAKMSISEAPQTCVPARDIGSQPQTLAPAPPPRRVARAMVSKPSKGSVPVTLGGKLPPVSILSRREFGLRVLRE